MRQAFTLLEMLIVCTIIGLVVAIAAPIVQPAIDSMAVERASREVVSAYALGRLAALTYGGAELRLDTAGVALTAGGRLVHARNIAQLHGVGMRASPPLVRYAATGLTTGLSNGSVILTRGRAADTIFVSRLGRVRR